MTVSERMQEFGGLWRWTNTDQQLADGLALGPYRLRAVHDFTESAEQPDLMHLEPN